ncbi:glycosyltransferase family 4 protein [Janibacter limosus]|uniref:glycosyltransferase family 4 protein n=1 Tax=Janibacter limosus TaxID=53458 RepID=UPI0035D73823|nr:glycosyltransferase family 4 protein [Janibacter limosus]
MPRSGPLTRDPAPSRSSSSSAAGAGRPTPGVSPRLLEHVWPAVHRATGAECAIAGAGVGPDVPQVAGVTVHGRVADLQHFLSDAWAIAVPLPESVGSPVKYAEALAVGCPVISTSRGAPGHRDLPVISDDRDQWIDTLTGWLGGDAPPAPLDPFARTERLELLSRSQATEPLIRWVERTGLADE